MFCTSVMADLKKNIQALVFESAYVGRLSNLPELAFTYRLEVCSLGNAW